MNRSLKYFSRHELTEEQRGLINKVLFEDNITAYSRDIGGFVASEDSAHGAHGDYVPNWEVSIDWITSPIGRGLDLVDENEEEQVIAGVFPADMLIDALISAQSIGLSLKVITFKFNRDRGGRDGQATVLDLASAIIYSVDSTGKLTKWEVSV